MKKPILVLLFEAYKFRVPMKDGSNEFDWKQCLKKAESDSKAGTKPNVNFKWPEPK